MAPIRLRKGLALAAWLAVERRAFSREYLAALLWPELSQHSALANLRRMLTYLRETLGDRCIGTEGDLVRFDPDVTDVDFVEFQSLLNRHSTDPDLGHLEAAAALYRGGFLEGFTLGDCLEFDEWQDGVRRRTEEQFGEVLESLCRGYLRDGQVKSTLPFARRWLELDQLNEAAHRMLMEIHARAERVDLARRQFETCTRTLSREGLEPEEQTRALHEAITGHRLGPRSALAGTGDPGSPARGQARPPGLERAVRRLRRRWIAIVASGMLVVASITTTYLYRRLIFGSDVSAAGVGPVVLGNELRHVRIAISNDGIALRKVRYAVMFSSDPAVVAPRDYMVYSDEVPMHRDAHVEVQITGPDLQEFIASHNMKIPPGTYSLTLVADPGDRIYEDSEINNRLADGSTFFYPGTAAEAAFKVEITYGGPGTLDVANPLKLFIGGSSSSLQREWGWARFVVASEGTYYLPLDDVPNFEDTGSGYFMVAVHDAGNDLGRLPEPGPGDVGAIYREGTPNLAYGLFDVARGTPIQPGRRYRIDFSPPKPPAVDAYEEDDKKEIGTMVDYDALPVRQRHTFHDEGTGDRDEDWFQVALGAGATIAVETFSAGGVWECDTAIDIADANNYIRTANDKSEFDLYSRLEYTNKTGIAQRFFFQVKPYSKYPPGTNRFADYVIEFR